MNDPFDLEKRDIDPRHLSDKQKKQAAVAGGVGVVAANETRGAVKGHYYGQLGRKISTSTRQDYSHIPVTEGHKISQKTHAPGVHNIPVETVNRYRNRPTPSKTYKSTRHSIQRHGFQSPVHVRVYENGADLWDGNHRAAIAQEVGLKHIPVHITHVKGKKPVPKTALSFANKVKHQRYRKNVLGVGQKVARVAKNYETRSDMTISAFGVDHGYGDIEKAGASEIFAGAKKFVSGFTGSAAKGIKRPPGPGNITGRPLPGKPATLRQKGFDAGAKTRSTMSKPGVKLGAVGAGGAGIGYGIHRNR